MDYVVELEFEGPGFVAVPNSVVDDPRIGSDALAVLTYLARLSAGRSRIIRVAAIRERFGFGKAKWERVGRELRAVGALADNWGRSEDGRNVVRSLSIGWPKAGREVVKRPKTCEAGKPPHRSKTCEAGNPPHRAENPPGVGRVTRPLKKEHTPPGFGCRLAGEGEAGRGQEALEKAKPQSQVRTASEAQPEAVRKADQAAGLGLAVRDPGTGEWRSATEWRAKRGGLALEGAKNEARSDEAVR